MSEKDRLEFLAQAESTFPEYFSFCFAYGEKDPALLGKMYDVLLWEKGLVGSSVAALEHEWWQPSMHKPSSCSRR